MCNDELTTEINFLTLTTLTRVKLPNLYRNAILHVHFAMIIIIIKILIIFKYNTFSDSKKFNKT